METGSVETNFMHVILGRDHGGIQKIVLLAPYDTSFSEVTCHLFAAGTEVSKCSATPVDNEVRNFIFAFDNLLPHTQYTYNFSANGNILNLEGGLNVEHLTFKYWKTLDSSDEIALVSCNGVATYKHPSKKWDMWRRLQKTTGKNGNKPKLLVFGGDQYYQDATETEWIKELSTEMTGELRLKLKFSAIKRAFEQTSDLSYRVLLAQTPSVAMLDDHDITDGAGGRFFDKLDFSPSWNRYAGVLTEVFEAFQASRNPAKLIYKKGLAYSFLLELGDSALLALDLRTEKSSIRKILMADDSKHTVFEALQNLKQKTVMILIPVVPIRNSRETEGVLSALAKICSIPGVGTFLFKIYPKLKELTDYIASMDDDLEDSLCSQSGISFFNELLNTMKIRAREGVQYVILTGDIHTGGSVEMKVTLDNQIMNVPIIVSSPIGYDPMPKLAEGVLKESTIIDIPLPNGKIQGVTNQFYTNRNFVFLTPGRLFGDKPNAARIYQEGVPGFKQLPLDSWSDDTVSFQSVEPRIKPNNSTSSEIQILV